MELLATSLTEWPATPENALSPQKLSLWFDHVLPLEFDADADIQQNAINAVEMVIPLLMVSKHQSHPDWPKYRNNVITKYVKEISVLFQMNSPQWYRTWCHCVQVLDIEIPRSATTLNAFLGIVEPALRSVIPMRRAEGYLCWRVSTYLFDAIDEFTPSIISLCISFILAYFGSGTAWCVGTSQSLKFGKTLEIGVHAIKISASENGRNCVK